MLQNRRTDLALEAQELWQESAGEQTQLKGVQARDSRREGYAVTTVMILDQEGAQALGKPAGTYVTLTVDGLARREEEKGHTLWRADKNGVEELFDGRVYWHLFVGQDALLLADSVDMMANGSDERVHIVTPGEDQPKEIWRGSLSMPFMESGWYLTFQNTYGSLDTVLYACHRDTGELFQHDLERIVQVNVVQNRAREETVRAKKE